MIATERIVQTPQRIDFHIHSAASAKTRDANKESLSKCTVSNIPLLVERLTAKDTGITMCAITDHDIFDYEVYKALKAHEGEGTLACVLPGVEFTVSFDDASSGDKQGNPTVIHIVVIFDDNEEKLHTLNSYIVGEDGKPAYDKGDAFSADKFTKIIREIELDSVLIGHEKSAGQEGAHDISSLGVEGAKEAILTEFVDAIELRSKHKEINIKRLIATYPHGGVPFVFGTDCHDWEQYPLIDSTFKGREDEVAFSSVKCLPSFRGLVMAITDQSRIKAGDCSFFSAAKSRVETIKLHIAGSPIEIPLSPGINAIIGDNSIGKSLLAHKLTGYAWLDESNADDLKKGYDAYCEKEGFAIGTQIPDSHVFRFDNQSKVRKTFEELQDGECDDYFEEYYQQHVDAEGYKSKLRGFFRSCLNALQKKVEFNDYVESLLSIEVEVGKAPEITSTTITSLPRKLNVTEVEEVVSDTQIEIGHINELIETHERVISKMDPRALEALKNASSELSVFLGYALGLERARRIENIKIEAVCEAAKDVKAELGAKRTDEENQQAEYLGQITQASKQIAKAVLMKAAVKNRVFDPGIGKVKKATTPMRGFLFVSELSEERLDVELCKELLLAAFNKSSVDRIVAGIEGDTSMTSKEFIATISNANPSASSCFGFVLKKIDAAIDAKLFERKKITNDSIGVDSSPSPGLYSKIYFDLIADADNPGIYIIDQPEDQISQTSIKKNVLRAFRRMAQQRQVLLITHNPQFVVNLDVDNVIAMLRADNGHIMVQSGALEYECDDYNMLNVVAETVEGGADVVRKRLKRYGSDED